MFWFNGWTVYLMKGVSNMAIKKYIGARYVPKFMGAWDKASEYAALSVVYANEQSYVSRKTVPANTEITNTEFWIKSADWNAQVTQYNQNVEQYEQEVLEYAGTVNSLVGKTVYTYNTKDDMTADKRVQLNDTLMTCGYAEVNDKHGRFYKVVNSTSASAIALQNNLFAIPLDIFTENNEYITPEQFGAKGDGTTDDQKAIQAAIDYASTNGVTLVIPSKTYVIKSTIYITNHIAIIGATTPTLWNDNNPAPTLSFALTGTAPAIKIDYYKESDYKDINQEATTNHVLIKNLKITGNNQSFCGIVTRCYLSNIENLTIERFTIGVYTHQTYKVNFRNVTTFYCDVGFFIGAKTYFNTNLIDCWSQYNNQIQTNTDANELIGNTLVEKFYGNKITGVYVYNSACRLIRFSVEAVFNGIYGADDAYIVIDQCGIENIPNNGYGLIAGGSISPSTIICNNIAFWNGDTYTGASVACYYRSTVILNNASTTNFSEAVQNDNSCLIFKSIDNERYIPITVTGLTGATVTDNRSKYNGDGTFTYDFVLNYTGHDTSTPIIIKGGPTLGVSGDATVFNSQYTPVHCFLNYGSLTTDSSHTIYAYPESGTRLIYTVKYNFK